MTIDLAAYRAIIKPIVKVILEREVETPIAELVGRMSIATYCPIIAICYYVAEITGMTPEMSDRIDRLKAFYDVDKVINQESTDGQKPA